ncbi:MAG: 3-oxoacyl-ACP reductase FabG [Chloroflexi bacterium]|nr:3-oxoacyl-ACP reductase FabG [Chloroflexota bacterium]
MKLEGRVAIVTGAGGGIGRQVALGLAREGADIIATDIAVGPLTKVVNEVNALGRKAIAVKTDVTSSDEVARMVKEALKEFGKIDILANIAGGAARGEKRGPFYEGKKDAWVSVINLNLMGTLICCHAVLEHMMQRKSGKIINIGSVAGMIGSSVDMADYSAAKAGVIGFTKALAKEVGAYGINVNCVSPGPIATERFHQLPSEVTDKLKELTWLKRWGRPEEIANMVVFLATDDASFVTGQNYAVCGGRSLGW